LGYADPPAEYYDAALGDYQSTVFVNRDQYTGGALAPNSLYKGGYDYITWLHEIGHALGLAHPHDNGGGSTIYPGVTSAFGSYGTAGLNQGIFTTMGYNDGWQYFAPSLPQEYGWQSTMMAFDVAALQYLYGANYSTATGNDGYVLKDSYGYGAGWQCIWDAAGSDYLYYGGNYSVLLDLRAATLDPSGSYGAGGFVSYVLNAGVSYSGFTIANGVTIESAFSGNGNDTVIGNASNNVLYTYSGNDTIYGLEGNDFIWGGAGSDAIYAGTGADTLSGSWGSDTYYGGGDSDGFYLNQDLIAGDFDYLADLTYTIDYVILPTAYQGSVYFYVYNGAAYGYLTVGGGAYVFGAAGLTAAQLQASTFFYG
jgi:serralysin